MLSCRSAFACSTTGGCAYGTSTKMSMETQIQRSQNTSALIRLEGRDVETDNRFPYATQTGVQDAGG
eukprot:1184779-Rhodomonas_salina.2